MRKMQATQLEGWIEFVQIGKDPLPTFSFQLSSTDKPISLTPLEFTNELYIQIEHLACAYSVFYSSNAQGTFKEWLDEMRSVLQDAAGSSLFKHKSTAQLAEEFMKNQNQP